MSSRGWLALLPILLWTLSGCTWTETTEHSSWLKQFNNQAISPEHALIEVALLERPWEDDYINRQLWQHTDELVVDLELRGLLEDNGFRIGQLVGAPPHDFQQMLLSKRCCSNPQAMIFSSGKYVPIYLGPVGDQTTYEVVEDKRAKEVTLDQARFFLDVMASFTRDGRTKFTFTPKVENGEPTLPFHAVPAQSTWELRIEKASNDYPQLKWEITLGPNQYLLVGGRMDRSKTIGQTAFSQQELAGKIQRLLVIRNCRSVTSDDARQSSVEELMRTDTSPPLAIQATLPAVRAKTH